MTNLGQITPIDGNGDFLPNSLFRPYADLDATQAAAFLREHGATEVVHEDISRHGQAIGKFEGGYVILSTNGFFNYRTEIRPGAAAWYAKLLEA